MTGKTVARYFSQETFRFLEDLRSNNDRSWFAANKSRYEETVRDPALRVIQDFAPHLARLSEHFMATPRSLFRIHRDTRFSKDKTPFKTQVGIHFRHERSRDAHAPGYYLHIEPGSVFAGVGIWHPDGATLRAIREHIVEEPAAWKRARGGRAFASRFDLAGDRLSRPPKGFDAAHPLLEDLKWKDYIGVAELDDGLVTGNDLVPRLAGIFKAGTPFMRFLCEALSMPF